MVGNNFDISKQIGGGEGNSLSEIIAGSTAANRQNGEYEFGT